MSQTLSTFPQTDLAVTAEALVALRIAFAASTPGDWWAECGLEHSTVTVAENGLRSVIARFSENALCPEHGGSAISNALFIARAHKMMPFLLECVTIANAVSRGVDSASLQARASQLFWVPSSKEVA